MKIRMGFVSNSSSSSFVLVHLKDATEKALENDKWLLAFVHKYSKETTVFGHKAYVTGWLSIENSEPLEFFDLDFEGIEKPDEYGCYSGYSHIVYKLQQLIQPQSFWKWKQEEY